MQSETKFVFHKYTLKHTMNNMHDHQLLQTLRNPRLQNKNRSHDKGKENYGETRDSHKGPCHTIWRDKNLVLFVVAHARVWNVHHGRCPHIRADDFVVIERHAHLVPKFRRNLGEFVIDGVLAARRSRGTVASDVVYLLNADRDLGQIYVRGNSRANSRKRYTDAQAGAHRKLVAEGEVVCLRLERCHLGYSLLAGKRVACQLLGSPTLMAK